MNTTNPCLRGEKRGKKEFGGAVVAFEELSSDAGAGRYNCTPREEWGLISVLFTL